MLDQKSYCDITKVHVIECFKCLNTCICIIMQKYMHVY